METIMETFKAIFMEKASDYKVLDIILKVWIAGLLLLFVVGYIGLIWGLISGEADFENATFGVFDYI